MNAIKRTSLEWKRVAALVLLAAALLLVGLHRPEAGAAGGAKARVGIDHFAYHPGTLRIARGTRVVFTNESGIAHTATRAGSFDTGAIPPGGSVIVRFTHRGTFAYHCKIHPFMHGKVVVR